MARATGFGGGRPSWVQELRRVRPPTIVVVHANGKETNVALRTGATRWQAAAVTAEKLCQPGSRVELRDALGETVHVLTLDLEPEDEIAQREAEDERDADADADDGELVALSGTDARLLGLLVSAQRMVLREQREMLGPVLDAYIMNARAWADFAVSMMEVQRANLAGRGPNQPVTDEEADGLAKMLIDKLGDSVGQAIGGKGTGTTNGTT